jgi:hypothetical protein
MNRKTILQIAGFLSVLICCTNLSYAENIDPCDDGSQYAYGENVGWVNFEPNVAGPNVGATVSSNKLTGFIWAENIGWINLDPNDSDPNTGVTNDGAGNLSGYAWGENVGWLNFDPNVPGDSNDYGVTIDIYGNFDGWAWGENIGWIHFQASGGTSIVDWDVLANFVAQWLQDGSGLEADLYEDEKVDFLDYGILANDWLNQCPPDWQLCPVGYKVQTSWTAP